MSFGFGWKPYVPVAQRRANAARELAKINKKTGNAASPVVLSGRKIAETFWGKAWCDNLEKYSDYENRLPRGRTYIRNGSVVDLQISQGKVTARVSGSSLYKIEIKIKPLSPALWKSIQTECAGKIDSLIELLQGKLSSSVMQIVTRAERGLFPTPKEIELDCSCPDWADLCKHVAASLYGVGARLDQSPELLFILRGVDPSELVSSVSAAEAMRQTTPGDGVPQMDDKDLADVFGIEMADAAPAPVQTNNPPSAPGVAQIPSSAPKPKTKQIKKAGSKPGSTAKDKITTAAPAKLEKVKQPAKSRKQPARRKMSPAAKAKIAAVQKARLAKFKTKVGE